MRPRTQEDPTWSPIISVDYLSIPCEDGSSSTALKIIHRTAYRPTEQIIMGRFLLPLRRGLFEVIVIAGERGTGWRESAILASLCNQAPNNPNTMTTERLQTFLTSHDFDSPEYDSQFPNHGLSRVRSSLNWLVQESRITVLEPPSVVEAGKEVELKPLQCRLVPPPRFLHSPNKFYPESNKQRFCRATLGGTAGVQMMVVSCWYGKQPVKGIEGLRQVAGHGARVIHEAQFFTDIQITLEEVNPTEVKSKSNSKLASLWFGASSANNKAMVITNVTCQERKGQTIQNTIGWIREPTSGLVFLVYFADTLSLDPLEVRKEIVDTLSSIRVPHGHCSSRRLSTKTPNERRVSKRQLSAPSLFHAPNLGRSQQAAAFF